MKPKITSIRIRPDVIVPWRRGFYSIKREVRAVPGGIETSVALLNFGTEPPQRHNVTEPEASVLWEWLLGERFLQPTEAGVLDLCNPEAALREAQAALSPGPDLQDSRDTWVPPVQSGFPPLSVPYGSVPEPEVPRVDFSRVRSRVKGEQ